MGVHLERSLPLRVSFEIDIYALSPVTHACRKVTNHGRSFDGRSIEYRVPVNAAQVQRSDPRGK
jgi:hypothetical protein